VKFSRKEQEQHSYLSGFGREKTQMFHLESIGLVILNNRLIMRCQLFGFRILHDYSGLQEQLKKPAFCRRYDEKLQRKKIK
jgi:hypothetical protein